MKTQSSLPVRSFLAIAFLVLSFAVAAHAAAPTFDNPLTVTTPIHADNMVMGDFDGDGVPDVAVVDGSTGIVQVRFGDGAGGFQASSTAGSFALTSSNNQFFGVAAADVYGHQVTGNDVSDLVFATGNAAQVWEWNGSAFAKLGQIGLLSTNINATKVAVGDLTGAGHRDIVVSDDFGSVGVVVIPNDGAGTFGTPVAYAASGCEHYAKPVIAHTKDATAAGFDDVILSNTFFVSGTGHPSVSVLLNNGDGTLGAQVSYNNVAGHTALSSSQPSLFAHGVVVADVDYDGSLDIVTVADVFNTTTHQSIWYLNVNLGAGDGTFAAGETRQFTTDGGSSVISRPVIAAEDLDGDGKPEIVTLLATRGSQTTNPINGFTVTRFTGPGVPLEVEGQDNYPSDFISYDSIVLGYEKEDGTFATFNDDVQVDVLIGTATNISSPSPTHSQFLVFQNTTGSVSPGLTIAMRALSNAPKNDNDPPGGNGHIVRAGDKLSYFIDVTNTGSQLAKSLEVTDLLPLYLSAKDNLHKGFPFVTSLRDITVDKSILGKFDPIPKPISPGTPLDDAGKPIKTIRWKIGDLAPGETKTVGFTIPISTAIRLNSSVANTVYSVASTTGQPATGADGATAPFQSAMLPSYSLMGTVSPASVLPGEIITYTVRFKNLSSQILTGIGVVDAIPADTFFFDAMADSGDVETSTDPVLDAQGQIIVPGNEFQNAPTQVIWNISKGVKAGQTATLTLRVIAKTDLPPATRTPITNSIATGSYKISGTTFHFANFDSGNVPPQVVATGVPITTPPALVLGKSVPPELQGATVSFAKNRDGNDVTTALAPAVAPGHKSVILFELAFANLSGGAGTIATGCYLKDRIPEGTTFVKGSAKIQLGTTDRKPAKDEHGHKIDQPKINAAKGFIEADGKTIVIKLPDITPNTVGNITYQVKLNQDVSENTTTHWVGASIGAANINGTPEGLPADFPIGVRGTPAFKINSLPLVNGIIRDPNSQVVPGPHTYRIFYKNVGAYSEKNVIVNDSTPAGTSFYAADFLSTDAQGQPGAVRVKDAKKGEDIRKPAVGSTGDVYFALGTLKAGESGYVQLKVIEGVDGLLVKTSDLINNPNIAANATLPSAALALRAAQGANAFLSHGADHDRTLKIAPAIAQAILHYEHVQGSPQGGTIQYQFHCGNATDVDAAPGTLLIPLPSNTLYTGNYTAVVDVPYTVSTLRTTGGQQIGDVGYIRVDFDKIPKHGVESFIVELLVDRKLVSDSIRFDHGAVQLGFLSKTAQVVEETPNPADPSFHRYVLPAPDGNAPIVEASPGGYIYPFTFNEDPNDPNYDTDLNKALEIGFAAAKQQIALAAMAQMGADTTQVLGDSAFTTQLNQVKRTSMVRGTRGEPHFASDLGPVVIGLMGNQVLVAGPEGVISNDGGSVVSHDGGTFVLTGDADKIKIDVQYGFGTLTAADTLLKAPQIVAAGGGNLLNSLGLHLINQDGSSLIDNRLLSLLNQDGSSLVAQNGPSLISNEALRVKSISAGEFNLELNAENLGAQPLGIIGEHSSGLTLAAAKGGYMLNVEGAHADKNVGKGLGVPAGAVSASSNSAAVYVTAGGDVVGTAGGSLIGTGGSTFK